METQFAFPVSPSHWGVGTLLGQVKQEALGSTFSSKFHLATGVWELSQADKMQNVNYTDYVRFQVMGSPEAPIHRSEGGETQPMMWEAKAGNSWVSSLGWKLQRSLDGGLGSTGL